MKNEFPMGNANHNLLGVLEQKNKYEVPDYELDINNQNDSHALIANRVPENTKVLDVGCATGIIGQLLKKYKKCQIDGIELDEEAIKVAKSTEAYNHFYNFSITDIEEKKYKDFMQDSTKYDYIIFADVLEHLVKPWEIIYNFSKKLKKNGKILISVPNANHIDVIKGLMNNNFNYNTIGIMDNTHLRFFTSLSFFGMMENYNKRYDKYFSVNYYSKTTCRPSYYLEESPFKNDNYNIVQHLFELTLVNDKKEIKYINKPKGINDFEQMEKEFNELKDKNKKLIEEKAILEAELANVKQDLNMILNSKRYKFASKIASIKNGK